jgi:hypothetical protein
MNVAVMLPEKSAAPAGHVSPLSRKNGGKPTAGMLVNRPDLSEEAVLAAIAERLVFEGRDPAYAAGVLKAALGGKPLALKLLRKLVVPAPQSALTMPIQAILRDRSQSVGSSPWLRLVSFGR